MKLKSGILQDIGKTQHPTIRKGQNRTEWSSHDKKLLQCFRIYIYIYGFFFSQSYVFHIKFFCCCFFCFFFVTFFNASSSLYLKQCGNTKVPEKKNHKGAKHHILNQILLMWIYSYRSLYRDIKKKKMKQCGILMMEKIREKVNKKNR